MSVSISLETALYSALYHDHILQSYLAGDRVYSMTAPEGSAYPYITFGFTNLIVSASCAMIPPISFPAFAFIINIGLLSILALPTVALLAFPFEFKINTSEPVSTSDR